MVQIGEFQRIAQEEHRCIVADQIPVAFLGVELQCKTTNIALGVGRTALAGHGGEASEQLGFLANFEKILARVYWVMSWVTVKVP